MKTILTNSLNKQKEDFMKLWTLSRKKPLQLFFNSPFNLEGNWLLGVTTVEIHNCVLVISEKSNEFLVHTLTDFDDPETIGKFKKLFNLKNGTRSNLYAKEILSFTHSTGNETQIKNWNEN